MALAEAQLIFFTLMYQFQTLDHIGVEVEEMVDQEQVAVEEEQITVLNSGLYLLEEMVEYLVAAEVL